MFGSTTHFRSTHVIKLRDRNLRFGCEGVAGEEGKGTRPTDGHPNTHARYLHVYDNVRVFAENRFQQQMQIQQPPPPPMPSAAVGRPVPPPILHSRPPPPAIPPMVKYNGYNTPLPPPPPPDVTVFSSQNFLSTFAHKADETAGHLVWTRTTVHY